MTVLTDGVADERAEVDGVTEDEETAVQDGIAVVVNGITMGDGIAAFDKSPSR